MKGEDGPVGGDRWRVRHVSKEVDGWGRYRPSMGKIRRPSDLPPALDDARRRRRLNTLCAKRLRNHLLPVHRLGAARRADSVRTGPHALS